MGDMDADHPADSARKLGYDALILFVDLPWLSLSEHF